MAKEHRKFNGKDYHYVGFAQTKAGAQKTAERFRKAGKSARIVKSGGLYRTYVR